jgi:DNA invertase Pin-like site-specific DNA recombinase
MGKPNFGDASALIARLRARAIRHRAMATGLSSPMDAVIAMQEAQRAELEADRIDAELKGQLIHGIGSSPLREQV